MITDLFAVGVIAAAVVALTRWRAAPFLLIVFGALQDPIRKLTPGTPAIMAVSILPIFCAACIQVLSRERAWPALKHMWPRITRPMLWFLISLLPATVLLSGSGWGCGLWPPSVCSATWHP